MENKKKLFLLMLFSSICIVSTACGSSPISKDDIEYDLASYKIESSWDSKWYEVYTYSNNTDMNIKVIAPVSFRDSDHNYIDKKNYQINCIGPGSTGLIKVEVPDGQYIEHVHKDDIYEKSIYEAVNYNDFEGILSEKTDDSFNVTIKNNSERDTENCNLYALFFDANGKVIDCQIERVNDGYLPAGEKITVEFHPDVKLEDIKDMSFGENIYY